MYKHTHTHTHTHTQTQTEVDVPLGNSGSGRVVVREFQSASAARGASGPLPSRMAEMGLCVCGWMGGSVDVSVHVFGREGERKGDITERDRETETYRQVL